MFTGIVEETGKVKSIIEKNDGRRITINANVVLDDLKNGDSIAVNGVCLTVEEKTSESFTIFAVPETLSLTNIGSLNENSLVNLERAVQVNDRLGGHIVQGHVETMAQVTNVDRYENHWDITISFRSPYLIPKGSISLDGISLTIHEIVDNKVRFQIIPETIKKTNIPSWDKDYKVNIETDYLIKAIDNIQRWREKES